MFKSAKNFIIDYSIAVQKTLSVTATVNVFLALIIVLIIAGFNLSVSQYLLLEFVVFFTTIVFILQEIIYWILNLFKEKHNKTTYKLEWIVASLLLINLLFKSSIISFLVELLPHISVTEISCTYFGLFLILIIVSYFLGLFRHGNAVKLKLRPEVITALSFAIIILAGAVLLYLPKSAATGHYISFLDALFTSTSSVCVTGLSTLDVYSNFSVTGKVVILLLIQVGGIGIMTLSAFLAAILVGKLSFKINIMLSEVISEDNLSKISLVLKQISLFTFAVEFAGAVLMYISLNIAAHNSWFYFDLHNLTAAIFHSVSSFCNAGLSIFRDGFMNPIVHKNYLFFTTNMALIYIGGIGFLAFSNLFGYLLYKKNSRLYKARRLNSTTKLIFAVTNVMVISGGLLVFFFDSYKAADWMGNWDKLFFSFYMIISAKTAGFDPIQVNHFANFGLLIIMVAMWIGASPGSTGGGIKNTTIGVLFLHLINNISGRNKLFFSHRLIDPSSIQKAQTVFFATMFVTCISILLLVLLEPQVHFIDLAFEAISAISTTGLSLGITPSLSIASKYVLIFSMYIGRIGVLTFLFAIFPQKGSRDYEYPNEKVIVG